MALADPQSVTYNAVATNLDQIFRSGQNSSYKSADGALTLSLAHSGGRRLRSEVRLKHSKTIADPLNPSTNRPYDCDVYLVINRPPAGYTNAEVQLIHEALVGLLGNATFKPKFIGGQS